MTVRGNVELGMKHQGVKKAERQEQSHRFLKMVSLSDFAARRPYELSGGMQQCWQIPRRLANDPEFVLTDEPFVLSMP